VLLLAPNEYYNFLPGTGAALDFGEELRFYLTCPIQAHGSRMASFGR
jgi:hypothetical protein